MSSNFSLAKALDYLLDEESRPPWFKALLAIPLIGMYIWAVSLDRSPTPQEDARRARQLHSRAVVRRKYLNSRQQPVLVIEQGTLLAEETDWGNSFFSPELTNDSFPPPSREAYLRVERYSLVAYAAAGDSLIKLPGALSATLKRGQTTHIFYFHSLWP
jgi:hypothetical protein